MAKYHPENKFTAPPVEAVVPNDELAAQLLLVSAVGEMLARYQPAEHRELRRPPQSRISFRLRTESGLEFRLAVNTYCGRRDFLEQQVIMTSQNELGRYELRVTLPDFAQANLMAETVLEGMGPTKLGLEMARLARQGLGRWVKDQGGNTYSLDDQWGGKSMSAAEALKIVANAKIIEVKITR